MEQVVIIGNGIAGATAARHIRKLSDKKIIMISNENPYFFSRTALMYVFMGHMKFEHIQPYENDFWAKNNIELVQDHVTSVDTASQKLQLTEQGKLNYDKLIIASGSQPNKMGRPGEELEGVQGLYSRQDLDKLEELSPSIQRGVIIGGGLIGIELAEMLHSRQKEVSMLVREDAFWNNVLPGEEAQMVTRHIRQHGIDLHLKTELKQILGDENGHVRAVKTTDGREIKCQFVGLTIGVHPNIGFLKNSGIETGKGIMVNRRLETNVPKVYAAGDCAQQREAIGDRKPVEQVWYTGRMMGEAVAQNVCGYPYDYEPGVWFNSAKFMDIEYQTYGRVWPKPQEYEKEFYWEHKSGRQALRLVYHKETEALLGVNALGLRLRHEVCDRWIREQTPIDKVVKNLRKANFDPELYKKYEKAIRKKFKKQPVAEAPT